MAYYHDRTFRVRKQKFIRRRTPLQEFNYGQSFISDEDDENQFIVMEDRNSSNRSSRSNNNKCDSESPPRTNSSSHRHHHGQSSQSRGQGGGSGGSSSSNSNRNSSDSSMVNRQNKQARDDHNEQERRRRRELAIIYELIRCCFDDDDLQIVFPGKLSRSKEKLSYPQILQIANEILVQESHDILLLESTLDDVKRIENQLLELGIQPPARPWQFSIYDNYSNILKDTEENLKADKSVKQEEGNYAMSPAERALHINEKLLQSQRKCLQQQRRAVETRCKPSGTSNHHHTTISHSTSQQQSSSSIATNTESRVVKMHQSRVNQTNSSRVTNTRGHRFSIHQNYSTQQHLPAVRPVIMSNPSNDKQLRYEDDIYLPPYDEEEEPNDDDQVFVKCDRLFKQSSPISSSIHTPTSNSPNYADDSDNGGGRGTAKFPPLYSSPIDDAPIIDICDSIFLHSKTFFKSNESDNLDTTIIANDSTCATNMSDPFNLADLNNECDNNDDFGFPEEDTKIFLFDDDKNNGEIIIEDNLLDENLSDLDNILTDLDLKNDLNLYADLDNVGIFTVMNNF